MEAVGALGKQYKDVEGDGDQHANPTLSPMAICDEWTPLDRPNDGYDRFEAYLNDQHAQVPLEQSPILY
jgi:hypothetical protein